MFRSHVITSIMDYKDIFRFLDPHIYNLSCIYSQFNQNQTEFNISICTNWTLFNVKIYNYYHSVDVIAQNILGITTLAIIAIGIIANILVLSLTTLDKTLHKPTFTAIGALSLADLFCLCSLLIREFGLVLYTYDIFIFVFSISSLHVLLIAILRYIILVYPFVARNYLSCKKIILSSLLCYVLVICIMITVVGAVRDYWYVFIISIFTYYVPFIITAIFHSVKYYKMKQQASRFNRNVDKMGRVVAIIIATSCSLPLPRLVLNAVDHSYNYVGYAYNLKIGGFFSVLSIFLVILNFVINPFLYCFLSKSLRDSCKSLYCKCRC